MTRRLFLLAACLLVLAGPAPAQGKKEEKKGWIGVQIRAAKDGDISITAVLLDSPAEAAKLKAGDVIRRINGVKATDLRTAVAVIQGLKPRQKAKVEFERDGKAMEVTVVVGER